MESNQEKKEFRTAIMYISIIFAFVFLYLYFLISIVGVFSPLPDEQKSKTTIDTTKVEHIDSTYQTTEK